MSKKRTMQIDVIEEVKGTESGLLFEPHNEKDLAAKIRLLMEDQLFYKSVSEKCKQRSEKYDVSVMGNRYNQLYQSLCR